eukprot:s1575_g9.t1
MLTVGLDNLSLPVSDPQPCAAELQDPSEDAAHTDPYPEVPVDPRYGPGYAAKCLAGEATPDSPIYVKPQRLDFDDVEETNASGDKGEQTAYSAAKEKFANECRQRDPKIKARQIHALWKESEARSLVLKDVSPSEIKRRRY